MSVSLQTVITDVSNAGTSNIKFARPVVTQCQIYFRLFYIIVPVLNIKALNSLN